MSEQMTVVLASYPSIELAERDYSVFKTMDKEESLPVMDLAVVRNELRPELFVQWAKPLALESVEIRRKVLGAEHLETAGSERFLASWIYSSWSRQRQRSPRSPMLPEARGLAQHALEVMEPAYGVSHHEVVGTRHLLAEIALAMQEYALAEELGMQLAVRYGVAVAASYAAFLLLIRAWIAYVAPDDGRSAGSDDGGVVDAVDALDVLDLAGRLGGRGASEVARFDAGGGSFGGGGASGTFGEAAGDAVSGLVGRQSPPGLSGDRTRNSPPRSSADVHRPSLPGRQRRDR